MSLFPKNQYASALALVFLLLPVANSHGVGGMNAVPNQIEAIEAHLQQSRTQSSREAEDIAKKKSRSYESGKAATGNQAAKQRKPDSDSEKINTSRGSK